MHAWKLARVTVEPWIREAWLRGVASVSGNQPGVV